MKNAINERHKALNSGSADPAIESYISNLVTGSATTTIVTPTEEGIQNLEKLLNESRKRYKVEIINLMT